MLDKEQLIESFNKKIKFYESCRAQAFENHVRDLYDHKIDTVKVLMRDIESIPGTPSNNHLREAIGLLREARTFCQQVEHPANLGLFHGINRFLSALNTSVTEPHCPNCNKPMGQTLLFDEACVNDECGKEITEPSVDRVREENEIVEKCADIGLYDDDDFTPPTFLDDLEGDDEDDFWEWIRTLLKASARNAIGMWIDRQGGNEG